MDTLQFFNFPFFLSFLEKDSAALAVDNFLRNCSFLTLFISMMFYWIQTAFSSKATPHLEALPPSPSLTPPLEFLGGYALKKKALLFFQQGGGWQGVGEKGKQINGLGPHPLNFFTRLGPFKGTYFLDTKKKNLLINFGTITMILSNVLLMFLLIFRWIESGHFPLSNLYESLMFLSWSCTFIHLILEFQTEIIRRDATLFRLIGSITSPSALLTNAFATFSLPSEMQKALPLVPALQSNWLMMHVTVMIISYSALILGSLLSIAFLILISAYHSAPPLGARKGVLQSFFFNKNNSKAGPFTSPALVSLSHALLLNFSKQPPYPTKKKGLGQDFGAGAPYQTGEGGPIILRPLEKIDPSPITKERGLSLNLESRQDGAPTPTLAKAQNNLASLAWNFDNLSYRVIGIGFPFLTIGILSGAVWANEAWGSYWSWDPKETWALLTWLIFAIYLHARITKGWQGKKPAIIASFGFLSLWVCFLGVNLIGEGLHSYGWFSGS